MSIPRSWRNLPPRFFKFWNKGKMSDIYWWNKRHHSESPWKACVHALPHEFSLMVFMAITKLPYGLRLRWAMHWKAALRSLYRLLSLAPLRSYNDITAVPDTATRSITLHLWHAVTFWDVDGLYLWRQKWKKSVQFSSYQWSAEADVFMHFYNFANFK